MSGFLHNSLLIAPILLTVSLINAQGASAIPTDTQTTQFQAKEGVVAQTDNQAVLTAPIGVSSSDQIQQFNDDSNKNPNSVMSQVTSVSQLSDVQPTDWAFQALQSLVERYGCIAGYPNGSFQGNRAMTRYEFAAGLNACLNRVNELIATSTADLVTKEDLETLRKLQEEFADGLVEIRGRIDGLEARNANLENQQFSTTTKLNAEIIFSVGSVFGGDRALDSDRWRRIEAAPVGAAREAARANEYTASGGRRLQDNAIFSDRIRLNLISSFTGKDQLFTRLEANNTTAFSGAVTGTNMTRVSWDGNNDNNIVLGKLYYRFPVGDKINV
ncbi:iron uptake porin, partial [Nostoc sp.]